MALPSLSGLALRERVLAHTGAGEKRDREDVCAELRDELAAVHRTLFESGPIDLATGVLERASDLIWDAGDLDGDDELLSCILAVLMEHLEAVMTAARRFLSPNREERTMSYAALKLLMTITAHGNNAENERLVTKGCVTLGTDALRERALWEDKMDRSALRDVVSLLHDLAHQTTTFWTDMMNGIDVLWELLKDDDVELETRKMGGDILALIAEHGDEYNGKLRVYEHGDLASWQMYVGALYEIQATFHETYIYKCNDLARTLADPKQMRTLLEAHPTLYDAVARMREVANSCWSRFDDETKAAIDAMLGSRGYQTVAALSPYTPSRVAAIALAKTLRGEAEAVIDDYQALFASPSLAPQAQDLVAATVEQAARSGELATLRASEAECEKLLASVTASESAEGAALQVHKAVEGVFRGYERAEGIVKVVHRLQAAYDPDPLDKAPNEDVERLREVLFATEKIATGEESPFSAHETNRLARMRRNQ